MYWDPMPATVTSTDLPVIGTEHRTLGSPENYLRGRWKARDWRNVPGPCYRASTYNWTGRPVAPDGVYCADDAGSEVMFRQPRNTYDT